MGWKVVEINSGEHFKLHLNNLLVIREYEKILININDIDTLLIHNSRAMFNIKLINALTLNNVNVIIFNELHLPQSHIINFKGHHMSLKILEKQISWNKSFKGQICQAIVKNKIANQILVLLKNKFLEAGEHAKKLMEETRIFDVTNRESFAAKIY